MENIDELQNKLLRCLETEVDNTSELLLQMNSMIKMMIIQFNQQNKFCKIVWSPSNDSQGNDNIELEGECKDNSKEDGRSVKDQIALIVQAINWNNGFKKALKDTIKKEHDDKLLQIDNLRNQTIEEQLIMFKEDNETQKGSNSHKLNSSTKGQLLSKTKQLTNNLIKSNGYLQSSILQSDLNLDDLKQQTSLLNKVNENYSQLEVVFTKTNQLVKTLNNASNKEKRDVYISIGVLCLAIAWVFWRRILKIPTKLLLWLMFKFFKGILLSLGLVKRYSKENIIPPVPEAISSSIGSTVSEIIATGISESLDTLKTDTIQEAVEEAMSRIIAHDEL